MDTSYVAVGTVIYMITDSLTCRPQEKPRRSGVGHSEQQGAAPAKRDTSRFVGQATPPGHDGDALPIIYRPPSNHRAAAAGAAQGVGQAPTRWAAPDIQLRPVEHGGR